MLQSKYIGCYIYNCNPNISGVANIHSYNRDISQYFLSEFQWSELSLTLSEAVSARPEVLISFQHSTDNLYFFILLYLYLYLYLTVCICICICCQNLSQSGEKFWSVWFTPLTIQWTTMFPLLSYSASDILINGLS